MSWYWWAALAAVVLVGLLSRRGERARSRQLTATRRPRTPGDIDELLRAGQKIEAIKRYRALHGVDLKTAREAVDARARDLGR